MSNDTELLSDALKLGKGFVTQELLEAFSQKATLLMDNEEEEMAEGDRLFLVDYIRNIATAKIADAELNKIVQNRANNVELELPRSTNLKSPAGFLLGPAKCVKIGSLALKAENFEGKSIEARSWIESFERMAQANDWTEATMLKYLPSFLNKSALEWFITLCQPTLTSFTSWTSVKDMFIKHYLGDQDFMIHRRRLHNLYQRENESVSAFIPKTLVLFNMAYPKKDILECDKIVQIIEKMLPDYQEKLALDTPKSIVELNQVCLKIEQGARAAKAAAKRIASDKSRTFNRNIQPEASTSSKERSNLVCKRCERNGHLADKCFSVSKMDGSKLDPKTAAPKPPKKTNIGSVNFKDQPDTSDHANQELPVETSTSSGTGTKSTNVVNIRRIYAVTKNEEELFTYPILINQISARAMLDTGAVLSLIDEGIVRRQKWNIEISKTLLSGANNQPIHTVGKIDVSIAVRIEGIEKSAKVEMLVVKDLCIDALIGLDILKMFKINIHLSSNSVEFEDFREKIRKESANIVETIECETVGKNNIPSARSSVETILGPRSLNILQTKVDSTGFVLVNPHNFSPTIISANSVTNVIDGVCPMLVANLDTVPVRLPANEILGSVERISESLSSNIIAPVRSLEGTNETVNVGSDLSETQLSELDELLTKYNKAFSLDGKIGSTNLIEHKIEFLPEAKPFREPFRRRPQPHIDEAKRQVAKMLEEGVIEESNSPFSSAYLLVPKKDGTKRMCIDFRKLNSMTKKWSYPLPNIEECLENLAGKKYFSTLDLASGYWQVPVSESSKEATAFSTENGTYHFRRMPFGLCNAPATFQKMVNVLFAGVKGLQLQCFIDDICLANDDWNEHLHMLAKVFELLIKANLTLKSNKCTFGSKEVLYLGHIISSSGIRQDPMKLKAIVNLAIPITVEELQRVLGLLSYYRRFVPKFAMTSAPLYNLTRKKVPFIWEEHHTEAFKVLIDSLSKNATLKHFRYGQPTVLKTDASKTGVGGLLQQRDNNGEWRLVVCCSRRLNQAENSYGVTELEALAIIYCVTKLRPYLLGHQFTILTDHCALCALNMKEPRNERLKRWAVILSSFSFVIKYIKGGLHRDVDCISRAPVEEATDEFIDHYPISVNAIRKLAAVAIPREQEEWLQALNTDPETTPLVTLAEANKQNFSLRNGILYNKDLLVVPKSLREKIMIEAHDEPSAAHGGVEATINRLAERFWWKVMREDVEKFVTACDVCQRRKAERQPQSGSMNHHLVTEPFETVAFDCLGQLPETFDHKRHVILAIDMFSRFVDAKAVKKIDSSTFAKFLTSFVGRFGVPKNILTDNAPTFINTQIANLCKTLNINHKKSTPQHSRGNSVAERAIESLQEKLSMLSNGELNEWSRALPTAVLALNTTTHKSTNFTPFMLLFSRRPPFPSKLVFDSSTMYDVQAELVQRTLDDAQAEAIARQSDAQAASRQYFEANHEPRTFEIGDVVLARRPGRKAKLTSRYVGPFKIVDKQNDIYGLESIESGTKLSRHIKDIKIYSEQQHQIGMIKLVSAIICVSICLLGQTNAMQWEQVSATTWKQTRFYASQGHTLFELYYYVTTPCDALDQFYESQNPPADAAIASAKATCQSIFGQLLNRLHHKTKTLVHPVIDMARQIDNNGLKQPTAASKIAESSNMVPHGQQPIVPQIIHQQQTQMTQQSVPITPSIATNQPFGLPYHPPHKRSVSDTVVGIYLSDVWNTVRDAVWTNPQVQAVKDRQSSLEIELEGLRKEQNITRLTQDALTRAVEINANLIETNQNDILKIITTHPALMVISADIVCRLHQQIDLLDRIRTSFRSKQPDLVSVSLLIKDVKLQHKR